MTLRPEFLQILGNWSNIQDVKDIPRRLKRITALTRNIGELTDQEQSIVSFMRDVQATREFVRRKPDEDDNNDTE